MTHALEINPPNVGFILSEAMGHYSRENGLVPDGTAAMDAGQVLEGGPSAMIAWAGSNTITGILLYRTDASESSDDVPAAYLARNAEVNLKSLVYASGDPTTGLKALGIIVRD